MIYHLIEPLFKKPAIWLKNQFHNAIKDFTAIRDPQYCGSIWALSALLFTTAYTTAVIMLNDSNPIPLIWTPVVFLVLLFVFVKLFISFSRKGSTYDQISSSSNSFPWIFVLGIIFIYFFIIFKYGLFQPPDTISQWEEVLGKRKFNDWQPVIHTYSLYLLALICKNQNFILHISVCLLAVISGCLFNTLTRYRYKKCLIWITLLIILFSPITIYINRTLLKDSVFGITLLACSTAMIHIWHTKGKWLLNSRKNQILLLFLLFYGSFVRHNGIFYTIPFILFLPLIPDIKTEKKRLLIFSFAVVFMLIAYTTWLNCLKSKGIINYNKKKTFIEHLSAFPLYFSLATLTNIYWQPIRS